MVRLSLVLATPGPGLATRHSRLFSALCWNANGAKQRWEGLTLIHTHTFFLGLKGGLSAGDAMYAMTQTRSIRACTRFAINLPLSAPFCPPSCYVSLVFIPLTHSLSVRLENFLFPSLPVTFYASFTFIIPLNFPSHF